MKKLIATLMVCFTMSAFAADVCVPKRTPTGRIARSTTQVNNFKKTNPCPANGKTKGSCPGYVVDHIKPLCACGPDTPANMQWQTLAQSKAKDKLEVAECKALKK